MAEKMLKKFDRYWEVIEGPMAIAIVLDPRYKLRMVEWTFEQNYGEGARRELDRIKYLFYDLLNEYNKVKADNLLKGVVQAFMIMIFQAIQKNVLLKTKKGNLQLHREVHKRKKLSSKTRLATKQSGTKEGSIEMNLGREMEGKIGGGVAVDGDAGAHKDAGKKKGHGKKAK
ncbi:Zinc finger BED domain-containing protein RICESLEEPER 1 [Linum perenne]